MRIITFAVNNYKSVRDSPQRSLTKGFNVVVGANNAGKTALAEALSLNFSSRPHRSLATAPTPGAVLNPESSIDLTFELDPGEIIDVLSTVNATFFVPATDQGTFNPELEIQAFREFCASTILLDCHFVGPNCTSAQLRHHVGLPVGATFNGPELRVNAETREFEVVTYRNGLQYSQQIGMQLAGILRQMVYMFRAERLNLAQFGYGPDRILLPDASNLAQVLNVLQANPSRFDALNGYLTTILPDIRRVILVPIPGNLVRVDLWSVDPKLEREDLAVPLADSGTGIGQVLAVLYVVLTSNYPRTIIIDEPQSFLHPGAVRKLIGILNSIPQHQYIVTTHSPGVVTAADLGKLLRVRKVQSESQVDELDVGEAEGLRVLLTEVGARLGDVFGADSVLWVEGRTEELCYPVILTQVAGRQLLGAVILGVEHTSDFEGRHTRTVYRIYQRLTSAGSLLPPALGFIFDREGRTQKDREDLGRESQGAVQFLRRRMFENYLLEPAAIASVVNGIDGFRDSNVSEPEIADWIRRQRNGTPEADWLVEVDGARLLQELFAGFSETRANYDKVEYGLALTNWIATNRPQHFTEIADLLCSALDRDPTPG